MSTGVFVIDRSALARQGYAELFGQAGMTLAGQASDPRFALQRLQDACPDVIVFDAETARADALGLLRQLLAARLAPVVVCLSHGTPEAGHPGEWKAEGVSDVVDKPDFAARHGLDELARHRLIDVVRRAAGRSLGATEEAPHGPVALPPITDRVVAIGVSTGGVQSIEVVLRGLDRTTPGIVMVQHMPAQFTASMAARLDEMVDLEVVEARDGDLVLPGRVLIAPGGRHMTLERLGLRYAVAISDGPPVRHHRPSVDVLFRSVARCAGPNALGIIMTGMGNDGAQGLLEMHQAGAWTAAQDAASCVVFGMPSEAIRLGAADHVVPLQDIAAWIAHAGTLPQRRGPALRRRP